MRLIKKLRRGKGGFTLVETLVTAAILTILIGLCSALIIGAMNTTARTARTSDMYQLGNGVYNFVSDCLRYATEIEVTDNLVTGGADDVTDDWEALWVSSEGVFLYMAADDDDFIQFYDAGLYQGATIAVNITEYNDSIPAITIEIIISDANNTWYTQTGTIAPLNADASDIDMPTTPLENPLISFQQERTG